jgi:DNA-binding transcriptional LysR family regulator
VGDTLSLEAFVGLLHLLVSVEGRGVSNVDSASLRSGFRGEVAFATAHFLVAPVIVATSGMVGTVPTLLARMFAELQPLRLFAPPVRLDDFSIELVWPRRLDLEPSQVWLRQLIVEVVRVRSRFPSGFLGASMSLAPVRPRETHGNDNDLLS